jgi:hypothetical protein
MRSRATDIEGHKYAFTGLFMDFILPMDWLGHIWSKFIDEWYCSQAVWFVLKNVRDRVSPRRLETWIKKEGFKRITRAELEYLLSF